VGELPHHLSRWFNTLTVYYRTLSDVDVDILINMPQLPLLTLKECTFTYAQRRRLKQAFSHQFTHLNIDHRYLTSESVYTSLLMCLITISFVQISVTDKLYSPVILIFVGCVLLYHTCEQCLRIPIIYQLCMHVIEIIQHRWDQMWNNQH
jgi:hypothetical protein